VPTDKIFSVGEAYHYWIVVVASKAYKRFMWSYSSTTEGEIFIQKKLVCLIFLLVLETDSSFFGSHPIYDMSKSCQLKVL
jgi:hypothetical protein